MLVYIDVRLEMVAVNEAISEVLLATVRWNLHCLFWLTTWTLNGTRSVAINNIPSIEHLTMLCRPQDLGIFL
jgi:hypothetical protein